MGIHLLSDSASVTTTFQVGNRSQPSHWHIPAGFLLNQGNCNDLKGQIGFYLYENATSDTSAASRWEALKCTMRGWIMAQAAAKSRSERDRVHSITIRAKEMEMSNSLAASWPVAQIFHKLSLLCADLSQILQTDLLRNRYHANRLNFHEGEKSPRLLAWRLRQEVNQNLILSIQSSNGSMVSDIDVIN